MWGHRFRNRNRWHLHGWYFGAGDHVAQPRGGEASQDIGGDVGEGQVGPGIAEQGKGFEAEGGESGEAAEEADGNEQARGVGRGVGGDQAGQDNSRGEATGQVHEQGGKGEVVWLRWCEQRDSVASGRAEAAAEEDQEQVEHVWIVGGLMATGVLGQSRKSAGAVTF